MLLDILKAMVQKEASDLFLKVGYPPAMRVHGRIETMESTEAMGRREMDQVFAEVAPALVRREFETRGEIDVAYDAPGVARFRVNIARQQGEIAMVMRHIRTQIQDFETLGLPNAPLQALALKPRGLILVTGTAGSGKSTTLATMIEYVNQRERKHVVTIEDPIEYVFQPKRCIFSQREIGFDTKDFHHALRNSVRQNPDIVLIGEMRDQETMDVALQAAETGHLVLSTLHTVNATQTVERIIHFFPPHQHEMVRLQLSLVLQGIVSQRLIPRMDGTGRAPAVEILMATPFIRELLAEGKVRDIPRAMKDDTYFGSQTFLESLKRLYQEERISLQDALLASDNPEEFKMEIKGIVKGSKIGDFDFELPAQNAKPAPGPARSSPLPENPFQKTKFGGK
ncbi:MAG: PilT/PilU family type 4a pilus ATPase [Planctomycetota bacterium]